MADDYDDTDLFAAEDDDEDTESGEEERDSLSGAVYSDSPLPEPESTNRFERMSPQQILALADRVKERGSDPEAPDYSAPDGDVSPWDHLTDEQFTNLVAQSKLSADEIDWDDADMSDPATSLVLRGLIAKDKGLNEQRTEDFVHSRMGLEEATIRTEADAAATDQLGAMPEGLTERLSDAEFEQLVREAKTGDPAGTIGRFAREKGLSG